MRSYILRLLQRARRIVVPRGDVEERAVRSGVLISATKFVNRLFQLGELIVLANLLSPSDFGLFGIAMIVLTGFNQFTNLGLDIALIQRNEENIDPFLDTAWLLRVGRSVLVFTIVVLIAPLIASIFNEPNLTPVLRFVALTVLVSGLRNPGIVYFQKDLEFHKDFVWKIGSTVPAVVVSLGVALISPTVWSLAFGALTNSVAGLVISYAIHGFRPRLKFDTGRAGEMLRYGRWITGSSIISYLVTKGDDVLVGWILGTASLGLYQMSFRLANAPATEFSYMLNKVLRPTYSKIQTEGKRIENVFEQSLLLVASISFPMALGILAVAKPFTHAFLGSKWIPMIPAMEVFAIIVVMRSLPSPAGSLLEAIGHPDYKTKSQFAGFVMMAIIIYPAIVSFGITGAAMATGARFLISGPLTYYLVVNRTGFDHRPVIRAITYPALGSAAMLVVVFSVQRLVEFGSSLLEFAASIGVGIVTYAVLMFLFDRYFGYEFFDLLRAFRKMMVNP